MRAAWSSAPLGNVDARADCADGVLEVEAATIAQQAALDVVLLGRHPRRLAVGRHDRRRRGSSARRGPGSRSRACRCDAATMVCRGVIVAVSTTTTWPPVATPPTDVCTAAVLSPGCGGVMNRDTYDQAASAVDGNVPRIGTDVEAAGRRATGSVEARAACRRPQAPRRHGHPSARRRCRTAATRTAGRSCA